MNAKLQGQVRFGVALFLAAAATAALPLPARAAGEPELASLLPRQAAIVLETGGRSLGDGELVRLVLPPEVLELSNPDLSDLRIFDRRGREVPYLIHQGPAADTEVEVEQRFQPRLLKVELATHGGENGVPRQVVETYELTVPDEPPEGGFWELVVETPRRQFVRRVEVAARHGGARGGVEEVLVEGDSVFRLETPPRERLRLALPGLTSERAWDRLVVTLQGEDAHGLAPNFRFESTRTVASGNEVEVPLTLVESREEPGRTVLEVERPRGLVPDRLRLATASPAFHWAVQVWDEGPGGGEEALARGRVFRLGNTARNMLRLALPRGDQLRVVIEHGDGPPPEAPRVVALLRRPALVFPAPGAGSEGAGADGTGGVLRFGARRVTAPHYGLEALLPALGVPLAGTAARLAEDVWDPERLIPARLGPVGFNPVFDPAPALAFALHPGAAINPRRFSYRRQLTVPDAAEGLHHLRLGLDDLARLRPDLDDLRIAGTGEHQWAYLLETEADHLVRPLGVEGPTTRDGRSRYRLTLPVQPARADRLALDTELPFFDRAYELSGQPPGTAEMERLSSGRLRRDLGDPRPVTLALPARRFTELELFVEDGDDAPLVWSRAEARFPVPEVYFAAPEGSYQLLVGSPDEEAPRYELERVRGVVLSVRSTEVEAGPLEPNPAYRASLGWTTSAGLQHLLLWGAVLLAVVLLTVLTLRLARGEGEES